VYASAIFTKTRPLANEVKRLYPSAIIGGTGWDYSTTLEAIGIDATRRDYSDYPAFRQSIGFTQRGCRLSCEFCVVPEKEGPAKSVASVWDIWRGEPYPRELLLLDNDFFGQKEWPARIREMQEGGFKVSFSQGINARMISPKAAEALASINYRNDAMDRKMLHTAWDNKDDEAVLFRGLTRLVRAGVRPDEIVVYMLIGYWAGETETDWLYRQQKLQDFGCRAYPMPYTRTTLAIGFQRWCVRRGSHKVSWQEYKAAKCRPEKVAAIRQPLPLFDSITEDSTP